MRFPPRHYVLVECKDGEIKDAYNVSFLLYTPELNSMVSIGVTKDGYPFGVAKDYPNPFYLLHVWKNRDNKTLPSHSLRSSTNPEVKLGNHEEIMETVNKMIQGKI